MTKSILTPEEARSHVPFLKHYTYLDSGATTPVPLPVQDAMTEFYNEYCANVERGAYSLAHTASEKYDEAREKAARLLLNCRPEEFIFTKNLTQTTNTVAYALQNPLLTRRDGVFEFGEPIIDWKPGDKVVSTVLEHHSNFMPWIRLAKKVGAEFAVVEPEKDGVLKPEHFESAVDENTRLVSFQHVSNSMGTVHPVKEIIRTIKKLNSDCLVMIDGSQGPGHVPVDVNDLGCDFYGFSGHKGPMGPPGTGGLFVKKELIMRMEPPEVGGGMMANVEHDGYTIRTDFASKRFDAGTPNIVGMIGLGRGAQYVMEEIGIDAIERYERELALHAFDAMKDNSSLELYGPMEDLSHRSGVVCFNIKGWMCHDVGSALDDNWRILVRSGHHCTIPLTRWLDIWDNYNGNVRASFGYFNLIEDVEKLLEGLSTLTKA